ncbi:winged helix-turn-helix transcriptional regulator [Sulfolobus acidocaldarius]|nr:helix-turn-helix domain-containing protein [Sulfolobus acidocaldarius]
MKSDEVCPVIKAIRLIGSENKLIVLYYLFDEGKGFNELIRLTKLNSKTLSKTLKDLEESGIVYRKVIGDRPFRVKYELTDKGVKLKGIFEELRKWISD